MQISQQLNVVAVVALLNFLLSSFLPTTVPLKMVLGASVDYCYSDIGCFPLSDEFYHPKHRPFNVRPWHRQHINTQFELFNKDHPEGFMMLPWNKKNLIRSKFNPRLETKIIVPGWLDNINRALWVRKLRDALLYLWVPVNIIVVRWTNFTPYTIATANTRVVGAEMANMMKFIDREYNYDPAFYHIIGHSLGAHIAGYCGDRIHGLGRITALDPARPFFQHMPKSVRLDRSDAKFIDAIHSDFTPENAIFLLMSYGMTTPVGHLDFYPNGPPIYQPGCIRDTLLSVQNGISRGLEHNSLSIAFLESIRYLTACDHQRSHEWFIESITNRECAFVGVRCNEFEGMINGRCTCDDSPSACAIMGIHADQMYLHSVHEELWPVRAGSIDYKYRKTPTRRPPVEPNLPNVPMQTHEPSFADVGLDLDQLGESVEHNYNLLTQAALLNQQNQQQQQMLLNHAALGGLPPSQPTKDEIYAHLKYQAMQMHNQGEPQMAPTGPVYRDETAPPTESTSAASTATTVPATSPDSSQQTTTESPETLEEQMVSAASEIEQSFDENMNVLDDMAFAGYLRSQLLLKNLDTLDGVDQGVQNSTEAHAADSEITNKLDADERRRLDRRSSEEQVDRRKGHPDQFGGHPLLVSSVNRDIESWYEDNGRWHLKTNNQPKYCSNQYQLLIFLGPLWSARGRDQLRADLLVSIVGTRGQLLNQRFVPRGSILTPFTMQPFFILLEGSYSLGQITSVALSWEARRDPDPVQATISFQSSELQKLGESIAIYKAKQFPWLPEETKYDKSAGFQHRSPSYTSASSFASLPTSSSSLLSALPIVGSAPRGTVGGDPGFAAAAAALYQLRYQGPSMTLKSITSGHYSQKYRADKRSGLMASNDTATSTGSETPAKGTRRTAGSSQGECSILSRIGCPEATKVDHVTSASSRADVDVDEADHNPLNEESTTNADDATDQMGMDDEKSFLEAQQQLDELQQLKRANLLQREEIRAAMLDEEQQQQQQQQLSYVANSQMPNQTYLVQEANQEPSAPSEDKKHLASDLNVDSASPYFVRLVDPIDDTASYKPRPEIPVRLEDLKNDKGRITIDLHNAGKLRPSRPQCKNFLPLGEETEADT